MPPPSSNRFPTVRTEGAILPADLLQRVGAGEGNLEGMSPESYHLVAGERVNEATNRAWNRLLGVWSAFQHGLEKLPANDAGTSLTRERWLLPLFQELGYGRLPLAKAIELEDKSYPISHAWAHVPIHLVGCRVDLDRRTPGVAGAAQASPHGLVQELLNRSEAHLWGLVSNGFKLRLLRDNIRLTRQAFVEFDVQATFDGKVYADFALLWRLCHQSRLEADKPSECWLERWSKLAQQQGLRVLDQLRDGVEKAIAALGRGFLSCQANQVLRDKLRAGNLDAQDYYRQLLRLVYRLLFLFVAEDRELLLVPEPPINADERRSDNIGVHPRSSAVSYVHRPSSAVFHSYYSTARLRRLAERLRGSQHTDLYQGLTLVIARLGNGGCPELALPALGSFLFSPEATSDLNGCQLANADLLETIRDLALTSDGQALRPVDYRNLGSEELGSIYESLLELHPVLNQEAGTFELRTASGHERKTTGSYYTPTSLITCLLDSALDPVLDEVVNKPPMNADERRSDNIGVHPRYEVVNKPPMNADERRSDNIGVHPRYEVVNKPPMNADEPGSPNIGVHLRSSAVPSAEQALLNLKICDPACGSGHFLIAAAHRIAKRLAYVRTGEEEPPPQAVRHALRDVIGRCIYGVDLNPMAVELCKVALWMEALEPGKPLSFLDHHIQCGNSLLGTTPALIARGIPDEAFEPIEGDDKTICRQYKKQNKEERQGYRDMFQELDAPWNRLGDLATAMHGLELEADDTLAGVRRKQDRYSELVRSSGYLFGHFLADAWCAAFVWRKDRTFDYPITERIFRRIEHNPHDVTPWMRQEIERLAHQYQFFHWHLAFPDVFKPPMNADKRRSENDQSLSGVDRPSSAVFSPGWTGGFDVVLGNPPWERIKLQEQEWFAERRPDIAGARNAAERRRMIETLRSEDPAVFRAFVGDRRRAEGESHFVRNAGRYALCGRGDVNTYAIFAETNRQVLNSTGRVGCIVPSGVATDDTTKHFFRDLVDTRTLVSLYDFENRERLFPSVDSRMKFCLLTLTGPFRTVRYGAEFAFFLHQTEQLADAERRFTLSAEDIALVNPNTRTCPIFRSRRDAELNKSIYRRVPVLIKEDEPQGNPWGIRFLRMLDMANDSGLFRTAEQLTSDGWTLDGNIFRKEGQAFLPLYEAKMLHQFDHRWATYDGLETRDLTEEEKRDANFQVQPRYWVPAAEAEERLRDRWDCHWLLGWRDITNTTNERTVIADILPRVGSGDTVLLVLPQIPEHWLLSLCVANFDSLVLDYAARQKVGGTHLKYHVFKQLPVLPPENYMDPCPWLCCSSRLPTGDSHFPTPHSLSSWLLPRVLELTYTAWDLEPFAVNCGYIGPPFRWDPDRRFLLRCELDAAFFHLYGIIRDDTDYIMETFPIVKRKDIEKHGRYLTKETILSIYDDMAEAIRTGHPYQTRLDPPPGPPAEGLPEWVQGEPRPACWPPHIHPPRHAQIG